MGTAPAFANAGEALDMVRAGLAYLATADATQLPAATLAECLRGLEQADAVLTAARASVLAGRVLDALGAKAGHDDTRSRDQRYHDALAEAMRRLVASDLLPERAGQPVKAWVHISLADLLLLDADSALQQQWTAQLRERW